MHFPWRRLAGIVVALLAIGFLATVMRSQWSALGSYHWQLEPGWALLSLLGLELTWLLELDTWRLILRNLGGPLTFRRSRADLVSQHHHPLHSRQCLAVRRHDRDGRPRRRAQTASWSSILIHEAIATAAGIVLAALYFAVAGHSAWAAIAETLPVRRAAGLAVAPPAFAGDDPELDADQAAPAAVACYPHLATYLVRPRARFCLWF